MARDGRNASRASVCSLSKRQLQGKPLPTSASPYGLVLAGGTGVLEGVPVAAKKLPIEDQVLKLLGDGLGDKEVAEKVGTTQNHVLAIRAASRLRPVTEKQLDIAKTIVARKRRQAAR
jgi:hypothetical protein